MQNKFPMQEIYDQLLNGQTVRQRPFNTKLPLPYQVIPGNIRVLLLKLIFRMYLRKAGGRDLRPPASYADDSVDRLISETILRKTPKDSQKEWCWPGQKRCALVVTHDSDTIGQERGIRMMRGLERARGIISTFSFVGHHLPYYSSLIKELRNSGFDIALHGVVHDNRIAFLEQDEIVERLSVVMERVGELGLTGFRSPSWYTSPALWSALETLGFLYDLSTLDTFPFLSKKRNLGVCTFYPYMVSSLVILPTTIPFELPWFCGYRLEDTLAYWKPKFDRIANSGGLIMINAHPDRWYCGNPKAFKQLQQCIDYILNTLDPVTMTAAQAANHTISMRESGNLLKLRGNPPLYVPPHAFKAAPKGATMRDRDAPLVAHARSYSKQTRHEFYAK